MVDQLSEQFTRHAPFLETRRAQACEQVEIVEVGNLADNATAASSFQIVCPGAFSGFTMLEPGGNMSPRMEGRGMAI